jgi:demethylspheroidene O-methyltransferase
MLTALPQRLPAERVSWREILLGRRDRLLASPKFQAWAAKFPLTRRVARREARALFDLCAGFVYAQTLAACIELNLFEMLAEGPLSADILAARTGLPAASLQILTQAAVSLRLLQNAGGKIRLGPLGAALRGNPGIAAMVAHHKLFYGDIADPVALLRGTTPTQLAEFWPYRGQAGQSSGYSALMAATQPMIAREIIGAYDFTRHKKLLDAGGGDGAFLRLVAVQAPKLALQLFDLPEVADSARARLGDRVEVFGGSFKTDQMPAGADIITLIRVLHDHDDAAALQILKRAHAALAPGGTLLLAEPMAGTKGAEPVGAAYFGFYLLAMGSGRARTPAEIEAMLTAAGFFKVRNLRTSQPMLTSLITAGVRL